MRERERMRRQSMGDELDSKVLLVKEICSISTLFSSCSHIRSSTQKKGFIDWYLILKVDEDSGIDVIRKRYRQLALQLHPDKNRHPKAEVAFKLISDAYRCLSDKARRRAFNSDRRNTYCKECHRKLQHSNSLKNHNKDAPQTKQCKYSLRLFREVQNRLKEECRVVENCLRVNEAASQGESPLFDPSDRLKFPDYPHYRNPDYWYFRRVSGFSSYRKMKCESPVYQIRSESRYSSKNSSAFRF